MFRLSMMSDLRDKVSRFSRLRDSTHAAAWTAVRFVVDRITLPPD